MKQTSTIYITSVLFLPTAVFGHWINSGPLVRTSHPSDSIRVGYHRDRDPLLQVLSENPLADLSTLPRGFLPSPFQAELQEYETDDAIEVAIDVPGVNVEDITVQLEDGGNILRLKGERSINSKDGTSFSTSRFDKSFTIDSTAINVDDISVSLDSGVLTIHLPKSEKQVNEANNIRKINITNKNTK